MYRRRDIHAELAAIKRGTDLVAVVRRYVDLKQRGHEWVGCCPFHQEKTASFTVNAHRAHCFGCSKHWDLFDFLADIERRPRKDVIREALQHLPPTLHVSVAPVHDGPNPLDLAQEFQRLAIRYHVTQARRVQLGMGLTMDTGWYAFEEAVLAHERVVEDLTAFFSRDGFWSRERYELLALNLLVDPTPQELRCHLRFRQSEARSPYRLDGMLEWETGWRKPAGWTARKVDLADWLFQATVSRAALEELLRRTDFEASHWGDALPCGPLADADGALASVVELLPQMRDDADAERLVRAMGWRLLTTRTR